MTKIERYTWEDALVAAGAMKMIDGASVNFALRIARAINWKPKPGKPLGLNWKNATAFKAVGTSTATYYRVKPELMGAGFLIQKNGNLVPTLPDNLADIIEAYAAFVDELKDEDSQSENNLSQSENLDSQSENSLSQSENLDSQSDRPLSEDTYSEDTLSDDSLSEDSLAGLAGAHPPIASLSNDNGYELNDGGDLPIFSNGPTSSYLSRRTPAFISSVDVGPDSQSENFDYFNYSDRLGMDDIPWL